MTQNLIDARIAFQKRRFVEALRLFQLEISIHPENLDAYIGAAESFSGLGEYASAVTTCDDALKIDSGSVIAHVIKAEVYAEMKNIPQSKNEIEMAYEMAPTNPDVLGAYGSLMILYGKDNESINLLEKSLEQDPKQYKVYHNLSFIYNKKGNLEKLLFCTKKIYELRPTMKNRIRLVVVQLRQKRLYGPLAGIAILLLLVASIIFHSWELFFGAILIVLLMTFLRIYLNTP